MREVYFTQIGSGATGMDRADGLPRQITVAADETITIDVNIDTGIR